MMKVFYKSINRISDNNGTRYHFIRRAEAVGHTKRIQEIWNPLNSCHIVEVGYRRAGQIKRNPSEFAGWVQQHLYQKTAYKIILVLWAVFSKISCGTQPFLYASKTMGSKIVRSSLCTQLPESRGFHFGKTGQLYPTGF